MPRRLADIIGTQKWSYPTTYPQSPSLPHQAVRGLVRGLLIYFSMPARRSGAEQIHFDRLEMCLLTWIEEQTNSTRTSRARRTRTYTNDAVNRIANSVPEVVTILLQHPSPLVLRRESEWLQKELAAYAALPKNFKERFKWVQVRLPTILSGLLWQTNCPRVDCPHQLAAPDRDELSRWLLNDGLGPRALTFHILAHYHGSTHYTVQRLLQFRTPRVPRAPRLSR